MPRIFEFNGYIFGQIKLKDYMWVRFEGENLDYARDIKLRH